MGVFRQASFQIESAGNDLTGHVTVHAKERGDGSFESVEVSAFGKTYSIAKSLLTRIPDSASGIELSFEGGYEELGGTILYVKFTRGTLETAILSIRKQGDVAVVRNPSQSDKGRVEDITDKSKSGREK